MTQVKSYTDIQRFKLDKLMKDPSRPAFIPERRGEKNVNVAPEFNHNIMGRYNFFIWIYDRQGRY